MNTGEIEFIKPHIDDAAKIIKLIERYTVGSLSCEVAPLNMLMWRDYYHYKYKEFDNLLLIGIGEGENTYFLIPFTSTAKNMKKGVELLTAHTNALGIPLRFFASEGKRLELFKSVFGYEFSCTPSRDDFEYIYSSQSLATLSGKKYHSKRNHISSFNKQYTPVYECLSNNNLKEVFECADAWLDYARSEFDDIGSALIENASIKQILPYMDMLSIKGGVIRIQGKIIAFCFGRALNNNIFDVNVEKCLPEYRTAYAVINNEFVKNELTNYKYVNREDDLGIEGLRKAKLSYHPEILLKKYVLERSE